MDEQTRKTLKAIIDETLMRLHKEAAILVEACQPIAPCCSLGELSRMEAITEQKVSQELLKQTEARIQRLSIALQRIQSPQYGLCLICEDDIAIERLKLLPESTLCITCANEQN